MAGHDVTVDLNRVMSEAPSQDQYLIFDIQAASTEDTDGRLRAVAHYKFKVKIWQRPFSILRSIFWKLRHSL